MPSVRRRSRLGRRPMCEEAGAIVLGTTPNGAAVTLLPADRRRHLYLIGKTGTGKSTLLFNVMRADLEAGRGFALLDPHGDLAARVAAATPAWRRNEVIYFDPADL